ncbi:hypothetical protein PR048_026386 [Dryococelus australis]|uniref:TTF-type domain-containing protein n=1 Tax=Dryococelus australis TaxID=614101 RepID=A0ABQ9GL76_9NEOP|nr:hypothetical protein PR048_026386 [Dryococelus australis]
MKRFLVKLAAKEDSGFSGQASVGKNVADELSPCIKILRVELTATSSDDRKMLFQSSWYDKFSWLEYSVKQDAVFCFVCRHFAVKDNVCEDVLDHGYSGWKYIGNMTNKHENSKLSTKDGYKRNSLDQSQSKLMITLLLEELYFVLNKILVCRDTETVWIKVITDTVRAVVKRQPSPNTSTIKIICLKIQNTLLANTIIVNKPRDEGLTGQVSICIQYLHNSEIKE